MLVPSDMILQAGAIVAPLMVTGLVAWNHLAGKVSRVEEQVRTQNGRLVKLEDGVVYRDTCAAVHTAASEAYLRIEERMEEEFDADVDEARQKFAQDMQREMQRLTGGGR